MTRTRRSTALLVCTLLFAGCALGACGGDDDDATATPSTVSVGDLSSSLPAAGELGLDERQKADWDNATDLFVASDSDPLVIGAATDPSEFGATIEDAGFEGAAGSDFGREDLNVRIRAIQFDSKQGALQARGLLHAEDLKPPCPEDCIVSPTAYELDDIPDSVAVHHVPVTRDLPPGESKVEAHHAEFVIGPHLYVVQVDGKPSPTFSADFDRLMRTVYDSASGAQ